MSAEQDKIKEDREFQIELLKIQIKNEALLSLTALVLSIEVSAFISLAVVYLSFGLTSGNQFYILVGVVSIIILWIFAVLTLRYFGTKKVKELLEKNLEKEFQHIRETFMKTSEATKTRNP